MYSAKVYVNGMYAMALGNAYTLRGLKRRIKRLVKSKEKETKIYFLKNGEPMDNK